MNEHHETMDKSEAVQRLIAVQELIEGYLSSNDVLTPTWNLLQKVRTVAYGGDFDAMQIPEDNLPPLTHAIISCDASITKNPGGTVAVGVVIQLKDTAPTEFYRVVRNSKTCNEGEYDAIYFGLTQLINLHNNPGCEIEVRSDSLLAVNQLNGVMKCNKERLQRKRDNILELVKQIPVPVSFQWRPRNSTPALEKANFLAQDALGVSRH
jgi:ribonuclease HI